MVSSSFRFFLRNAIETARKVLMKIQLPSGNIIDGSVIFKGVESDFATQRDVSRTKRDIKTFSVKVAVANPGRRLISGMTATVLLPPLPSTKKWWQSL